MTRSGYIFIGGASRTGTSLLRCILNHTDDVAICDETHFFGNPKTVAHLGRILLNRFPWLANWSERFLKKLTVPGLRHELAEIGDISTDTGAKKIVDYLYDNCRRCGLKNTDRRMFLHKLLASDRTDRAVFDLMMTFYAQGKFIQGEKTPVHIHYVPILLEWFPNAKIIHTFRDPRAIFILHKKKPVTHKGLTWRYRMLQRLGIIFDFYLSLNVIISWLRVIQLCRQYQQLYPQNYYIFNYEGLIRDPETYLKKLCDFLEIDFTEKMLRRAFEDPGFRSSYQQHGDIVIVDDERRHLSPVMNKWFIWLCKNHLLEFGYAL